MEKRFVLKTTYHDGFRRYGQGGGRGHFMNNPIEKMLIFHYILTSSKRILIGINTNGTLVFKF
jgi:hypothetical protein